MKNSSNDEIKSPYSAPALDKGLDIIELLANLEAGITQIEIARLLGRNQNEIYRMLHTLHRRGYVAKSSHGGGYFPGPRMSQLAYHAGAHRSLFLRARTPMMIASAKCLQPCILCVVQNQQVFVAEQVKPAGVWSMCIPAGTALETGNAATVLSFAAFSSAFTKGRRNADRLPQMFELFADHEDLEMEVLRVRERGHAQRPNDLIAGIMDLAFPVLADSGNAVAVIYCPYLMRTVAGTVGMDGTIRVMSDLAVEIAAVFPDIQQLHPFETRI